MDERKCFPIFGLIVSLPCDWQFHLRLEDEINHGWVTFYAGGRHWGSGVDPRFDGRADVPVVCIGVPNKRGDLLDIRRVAVSSVLPVPTAQCLAPEALFTPFKYLGERLLPLPPSLRPPGSPGTFLLGFDLCLSRLGGPATPMKR